MMLSAVFEGVDGATPSLGDVNHDGLPDILVGGHGAKHEITTWLYLNKGDFVLSLTGLIMMILSANQELLTESVMEIIIW